MRKEIMSRNDCYLELLFSLFVVSLSSILCRRFRSEVARRRCINVVMGLSWISNAAPDPGACLTRRLRSDEDLLRFTTRGRSPARAARPALLRSAEISRKRLRGGSGEASRGPFWAFINSAESVLLSVDCRRSRVRSRRGGGALKEIKCGM